MPSGEVELTALERLTWLREFVVGVRGLAAGHARGGLGNLHQQSGVALEHIAALSGEFEPKQLVLTDALPRGQGTGEGGRTLYRPPGGW